MSQGYHNIQFLLGAHELRQLPADEGIEIAFAGRSNAGKSSAINRITGRKALARTSKTPGRTREINLFEVEPGARIVDLPGYGYAKVSDKVRRHWQGTLSRYLQQRRSLSGLLLLMDVRHPLTEFDRGLLNWCAAVDMRVHVLLPKADKLSRGKGSAVLQKVRGDLTAGNPGCTVQLFSALKGTGVEQARALSLGWLNREIVVSDLVDDSGDEFPGDAGSKSGGDADVQNSNGNEN
jgi:GTP-binding protein